MFLFIAALISISLISYLILSKLFQQKILGVLGFIISTVSIIGLFEFAHQIRFSSLSFNSFISRVFSGWFFERPIIFVIIFIFGLGYYFFLYTFYRLFLGSISNINLSFYEDENLFLTKRYILKMTCLYSVSAWVYLSLLWYQLNFSVTSFEAFIFHFNVTNIFTTNPEVINDYVVNVIFSTFLVVSFIITFSVFHNSTYRKLIIELKTPYLKMKLPHLSLLMKLSLTSTILVLFLTLNRLEIFAFVSNFLDSSTFIEETYVDPHDVPLEFGDRPRNLVIIYLESFESTYFSSELGGMMNENLIPELTEILTTEGISFSHQNSLGGIHQIVGTGWTMAGLLSSNGGIPLKLPLSNVNLYRPDMGYMPGIVSLGRILESLGYNQTFMIGSDADFGGRRMFFETHGNFRIFDYNYALDTGRVLEDDFVWWGFEDALLFDFAKKELTRLAIEENPFNFTMLTVDTHHVDGYLSNSCDNKFAQQYASVINCSNKQAYKFIRWIQNQDWYENTTIVVLGDHLSMDPNFFTNIPRDNRKVFNMFINSAVNPHTTHRQLSMLDMFPTILASMGVKIAGNRLGLGVNAFSEVPSLIEIYGLDYLNDELSKFSTFYNEVFFDPERFDEMKIIE